ncbi:radical SAM protein [archaeon]
MDAPVLKGYMFSKEDIDLAVREQHLLMLLLAFNTECNLACPFCFTSQGKKSAVELAGKGIGAQLVDLALLKQLIDQGGELGVKSVCIWGEGEPMLDKKTVFELVDYANSKGMTPVVFTNGTFVDEHTAKQLFEKNVSVVGKLYSFDPAVNEELTGGKRRYSYVEFAGRKVPSHIMALLEAGFAGTNRFALHTVVTTKNIGELSTVWRWEREQGIIPFMDFLYMPNPSLDLGVEERVKLQKQIWELDKGLGFDYGLTIGPALGPRKCDTRASLFVGAHGIARVCGATYRFLGDTRTTPLKQIIQRKQEVDAGLCRGTEKGCVFCDCYLYNQEKVKK